MAKRILRSEVTTSQCRVVKPRDKKRELVEANLAWNQEVRKAAKAEKRRQAERRRRHDETHLSGCVRKGGNADENRQKRKAKRAKKVRKTEVNAQRCAKIFS